MCVQRVTTGTVARVGHSQVALDEVRGRRLRNAVREHGTSVEAMVQAAWSVLLHALTGEGALDETTPIRRLLSHDDGGPAAATAVRLDRHEIDARVYPQPAGRARGADRAVLEVHHTPAVTLRLCYPTATFGRCAADKLVDCLLRVLEAMVVAPDQPICRVEVLGDEDRRCIRGGWADPSPSGPSVVELFEDQADRLPDAVAITCGERALTYAQLDGAANRLANWLIAGEADPPRPLTLRLPVSADLVVGLLAALKAGIGCVLTRTGGAPAAGAIAPAGLPDARPARPPRAAVGAAFVTVADTGFTVHHGELLNLLLSGCLQRRASAATAPPPGSPADLLAAVLVPLITGATLVVVPDAVAV